MKILYGYLALEGYNNRSSLTSAKLRHLARLQKAGFDVKPFCMNINTGNNIFLSFSDIHQLWKWKSPALFEMYERFRREIEDCDIFYNSVGVHFHPDFVSSIPQFTVFGFNDDPESSFISRPMSQAYDLCAIGNIAEIETYKSWGIQNIIWQPMGFSAETQNLALTREKIMSEERPIKLFLMCDKLFNRTRKKKLDVLDEAFPNAHFYGRGWKRGFLPEGQETVILKQARLGINIHNSTGPINTRLYYLPANGVCQICDNKEHLGKVYALGKEVVGFNTQEECVELCNYYLTHEDKARAIAAAGWEKAIANYSEVAVFNRLQQEIAKRLNHCTEKNKPEFSKLQTNKLSGKICETAINKKNKLRKTLVKLLKH